MTLSIGNGAVYTVLCKHGYTAVQCCNETCLVVLIQPDREIPSLGLSVNSTPMLQAVIHVVWSAGMTHLLVPTLARYTHMST